MSRPFEQWRSSTLRYERLAAAAPLTAESVDLVSGTVKGVASVFGSVVVSMFGKTKILPGAFQRTLTEHPDRSYFKFFDQHQRPCGILTKAEEAFDGLRIEAKIANTALGRDLMTEIRLGVLRALSIGFTATKERFEKDNQGDMVRLVDDLDLFEVSAVPWGADAQAHIQEAYSRRWRSSARLEHNLARLREAELLYAERLAVGARQALARARKTPWQREWELHEAERDYLRALLRQGSYTPSWQAEYRRERAKAAQEGRLLADGRIVGGGGYVGQLQMQAESRQQFRQQERERALYEAEAAYSVAACRRTGYWHVEAWNH